jgi:hypothetical protein
MELDPTANVLGLVDAAVQRQDDLRTSDSSHLREIVTLRAEFEKELRTAEAARVDAIRSVDVQAVQRAAEVAQAQATTLAVQVAASAEAMRTQVAAAAQAATIALAAALEPIQKDIAELRKVQYETAGNRVATLDSRDGRRLDSSRSLMFATVLIATLSTVAAIVLGVIAAVR